MRYAPRHCRMTRVHSGAPCPTPKPSTRCIPPPARRRRSSISSAGCATTRSSEEVRHYARRHLLDTVGVMIAGAPGDVATRAEAVVASVRPAGNVPVPGRARRADLLDAAFLGGTAAHGIELDDGYRHGSAHCGCTVIPAALSVAYTQNAGGAALIEAIVAGYETAITLARACAPDLRQRGFHPTSAVGPFGAAMATGKAARAPRRQARPCARACGVERGRAVRLRQRRRRHQAAARRPRLARRPAGGAARRAGRRGAARRDRERATASCRRSRSAAPTRRAPSRCRRPCRSASPTATSSRTPAAATSSRRSRRCSGCSTTRRSRPTTSSGSRSRPTRSPPSTRIPAGTISPARN